MGAGVCGVQGGERKEDGGGLYSDPAVETVMLVDSIDAWMLQYHWIRGSTTCTLMGLPHAASAWQGWQNCERWYASQKNTKAHPGYTHLRPSKRPHEYTTTRFRRRSSYAPLGVCVYLVAHSSPSLPSSRLLNSTVEMPHSVLRFGRGDRRLSAHVELFIASLTLARASARVHEQRNNQSVKTWSKCQQLNVLA